MDAADFTNSETCSFIRLYDAFCKTLLKAAKNNLRQPITRAEFRLIGALISNWHKQRIMGNYEKRFFGGLRGVSLIADEKLMSLSTAAYLVNIR